MLDRNRKIFITTSIYDLLCRVQKSINDGSTCVLECVSGKNIKDEPCDKTKCEMCIQKWLNDKP